MIEPTQELRDRVERLLTTAVSVVMVPEWRWIDIMNVNGISNANISFEFGQSAGIDFDGKLTLIARDAGEVLVRYEAPDAPTGGTQAPSGAIFFLPADEYDMMNMAYQRRVIEMEQEMELVSALLNAHERGRIVTVPKWQWVHIRNLQPIANRSIVYKYDSKGCIDAGGRLQERGRDGSRVLVEYTAPRQAAGTELPTGSIFFVSAEEFDALS